MRIFIFFSFIFIAGTAFATDPNLKKSSRELEAACFDCPVSNNSTSCDIGEVTSGLATTGCNSQNQTIEERVARLRNLPNTSSGQPGSSEAENE